MRIPTRIASMILLVWVIIMAPGCQQFPRSGMGFSPDGAQSAAGSRELRPEQKADIQCALAQSAELRGDVDRAIQAYEQAIALDGRGGAAYHRLALLHDKKGQSATAQAFYREALARDPAGAEVYCDYGYSCYLQGQFQEAEASFRQALQLQPDLDRAHNNLALLLGRSGRAEEALYEFAAAGASESEAHVNLAFALLLDGRVDEAAQQLDFASRLGQNSAQARIARLGELIRRARAAAAPERELLAELPAGSRVIAGAAGDLPLDGR
jgi:Flp pilus assembly protein TadD